MRTVSLMLFICIAGVALSGCQEKMHTLQQYPPRAKRAALLVESATLKDQLEQAQQRKEIYGPKQSQYTCDSKGRCTPLPENGLR